MPNANYAVGSFPTCGSICIQECNQATSKMDDKTRLNCESILYLQLLTHVVRSTHHHVQHRRLPKLCRLPIFEDEESSVYFPDRQPTLSDLCGEEVHS